MIRIEWDMGKAPEVLAALQDGRLAAKCAKKAAEAYHTSILDWIGAGKSFTGRSGLLEGSIGWRPEGGGALVCANMEYAPYVEFGTGLHGPK